VHKSRNIVGIAMLAAGIFFAAPLNAQTVTATLGVGGTPSTIAVNPVTNKIYVANFSGNTVSVIDGASNTIATINVGMGPSAEAVNTITNKIYVANFTDNSVTVIDGATNSTTSVTNGNGIGPFALAVNPATNTVYVANQSSGNVTVLDGTTNTFSTVGAGTFPVAIALNPVTNQVYVVNGHGANVTVIDGATNNTTTIVTGTGPTAVAVNPVTNRIYVPNTGSNTVTVIDGATNNTTTVAAATMPFVVAVNALTNKIYVSNTGSNNVTVIDGATNNTATVAVGTFPNTIAVDSSTNQIYVGNSNSNNVTVIDGATNTTATLTAGSGPEAAAVNPVTDKIYIGNANSNNVTVIDGATNTTATVATGTSPNAVAANPATNQIYVANHNSANVTVIDGTTNTTVTVPVGTGPAAVAVNPLTNQIYVGYFTNSGVANNVTVIDGATNTTTTITDPTAFGDQALAVNAVTNQIYVTNSSSGNVMVIDGATNNITTIITSASGPVAVAVNEVTNKIYVANGISNNVTVIDGLTNAVATITDPNANMPQAVAVNAVTNQIYVANVGSNNVTVIDGQTNAVTTVTDPNASEPLALSVNPVTNQIYVANANSANITVIDGATNATTTVAAGTNPQAVGVNPGTNKIYVANSGSGGNVTVIDGSTNTTTTVTAGLPALALAVNAVTNKIYVADGNFSITVITEEQVQAIPLTVAITPLAGNTTTSATPLFTFTAASTFAPTAPPPDALYFQFDSLQGPWTAATPNLVSPGFSGTAPTLSSGTHTLYAYATDGQDATSVMTTSNGGSSPLVGTIASYVFTVTAQASGAAVSLSPVPLDFSSVNVGSGFVRFETVMNTGTSNLTLTSIGPTAGTDPSDYVLQGLGTCVLGTPIIPDNSCTISVTFMPTTAGPLTATVAIVDNAADSPQTIALTGIGVPVPGSIAATGGTPQSATINTAFAAPLAATVTDVAGAPAPGIVVTFTAPATGPGGTFAGSVITATTNSQGVATSTVFSANATVGNYTVSATVPGVDSPAIFSLTNTAAAAPANITATSGTPQSATINAPFAAPFVVSVTTAAGTPVSGASVTFSTPDSGSISPNGTFPGNLPSATATTNANGLATSPILTANNFTGAYTVTARVLGLNATANFALTNTNNNPVPTLTSISPTSGPLGQPVTLTLTGNNFIQGAVVNFGGNADSGGVVSENTLTITVPATQLGTAGPVSITVTNPAPTAGPSGAQTFTVNSSTNLVIKLNGNVSVSASTPTFSFPVTSTGNLAGVLNSRCDSPTISCLISPCPTNLAANGTVMMTVSLFTSPQAIVGFGPSWRNLPSRDAWRLALGCLAGLLLFGLLSARKPRLRWGLAAAALALALVGGCGGSGPTVHAVPAGTYAMTITENVGSTTQTAQVTLNVQ
jgi:YVTN family beta-propeller protein